MPIGIELDVEEGPEIHRAWEMKLLIACLMAWTVMTD